MPSPRRNTELDAYAALRHGQFSRFLAGNFFATLGGQMQTVAIAWYLYERTDSALALGGVGLAQVLPIFLLTLPVGHLADRVDRKNMLQVAMLLATLNSFALAALAFVGGPVWLIYALLVLSGCTRALAGPARDAVAAQLLPNELLANATTWRTGLFQLACVIGPAVGGLVIAATNSAAPVFVLAGLGALLFAVIGLTLQPRPYVPTRHESVWKELTGGVRFLREKPILIATITLDMFAVLLGGATMLLPIFAKDILHVGPRELGWMMAAPSIGAIIVAVWMARHPLQRAGPSLLWAVSLFGVATIGFGLSKSLTFSLVMLALIGAFDMVSVVIRHTLVMVLTPDELRGRVSAINALFIGTSNELGGFESGVAAALVGPVLAVVLGGVGSIVCVLIVARVWPEVARYGELK